MELVSCPLPHIHTLRCHHHRCCCRRNRRRRSHQPHAQRLAGEARLKDIAAAASCCGSVLLATDPDREGEAISWHITQELQVS